MRNVMELKDNWMFVKEAENAEDAASKEGTAISLPHTWNAVDGQDGGNDYHRGTCWYVTKFQKPELEAGSQVYVEFLGASVIADVYLNGEAVAHHEGGYSTFRVNLIDKLQEENILWRSVSYGELDCCTRKPFRTGLCGRKWNCSDSDRRV